MPYNEDITGCTLSLKDNMSLTHLPLTRSAVRTVTVVLSILTLLVILLAHPAHAASQQLVVNGGFESGTTAWNLDGAVITSGGNQHSGTNYAVLGEIDGEQDLLSQVMTVPSGAGMSTAEFYYYIYSDESITTVYDRLEVDLKNLTTGTSYPIARLSNRDGGTCTAGSSCYKRASATVDLAGMVGDKIQIVFHSYMDVDTFTSFKVDDVSLVVDLTTIVPLVAPTNLLSNYNPPSNSIVNTWNWNGDAATIDGFRVYRKVNSGSYSAVTTTAKNVTMYQDTNISPGNTYTYKIAAYKGTSESTTSNEEGATVPSDPVSDPLTAPYSVTTTYESGTNRIAVAWAHGGGTLDGYRIYKNVNGGAYSFLANDGLSPYLDTTVTPGDTYCYRVTAYRGTEESSNGAGDLCETVPTATPTAPNAPTGVTASQVPGTDDVRVQWSDNSNNETGFNLFRRNVPNSFFGLTSVGANVTAYTDTSTYYGQQFCYTANAKNDVGVSANATEGCVTVTEAPATDVCPNLGGVQTSVPAGYQIVNGQCVVTSTTNTPPVIHIPNDPTTIEQGSAFNPWEGVTITDAEDGPIATTSAIVTGAVDTSTLGTYTLTYTVADSDGLAATPVVRMVIVEGTTVRTPPKILLSGRNPALVKIDANKTVDLKMNIKEAIDQEGRDVLHSLVVTVDGQLADGGFYVFADKYKPVFVVRYQVVDSKGMNAFVDQKLYPAQIEGSVDDLTPVSVPAPQKGVLVQCGLFQRNLPTIVLTHGLQNESLLSTRNLLWNGCASEQSAGYVLNKLLNSNGHRINILTYSWDDAFQDSAAPDAIPYVAARTHVYDAGMQLSRMMQAKLGVDYVQKLHFIGHSLGTAVNTYAARDFLQRVPGVIYAQFTILDFPNRIADRGFLGLGGIDEIGDPDEWKLMLGDIEKRFGFAQTFFESLLPLTRQGLTLKVDNYWSPGSEGVGSPITGPRENVYNHYAFDDGDAIDGLESSNDVGGEFFAGEAAIGVIDNDHSGVHQWYRWTMSPNDERFFDGGWDGKEYCMEGDVFDKPSTFDESLNPCGKGWSWALNNPRHVSVSEWVERFPKSPRPAISASEGTALLLERQVVSAGCTLQGEGLYFSDNTKVVCVEKSSPFIVLEVMIPEGTDYASFDYKVGEFSDGDYFVVLLDQTPIWTLDAENAYVEQWVNTGKIPLVGYDGVKKLTIALYGAGEQNAEFGVSNFKTYEAQLSDQEPPITEVTVLGTQAQSENLYAQTADVVFTASDYSGVKKTEYSFDSETWTEYADPIEVTNEGTYTIYYRSTDWFGNVEETKSVTFTIVIDDTPPVTTLSASGTGNDSWFRSDIEVTLNAGDDKTGVASTTYSLDNGTTWQDYTAPFTLTTEGTHTVLYRSVDGAGNLEDTKTATLYIDRTAPEARVSADVLTKDLKVVGTDNMGSTTVEKTTTGYAVTDEAGNTTKLTFERTYQNRVLTLARLASIQYGTAPVITLAETQFVYVWTPWKGVITLTNQTVRVDKVFTVNATYVKPLNTTTVTVSQNKKQIKKQTFPGLRLVTLTTAKGTVGYEL